MGQLISISNLTKIKIFGENDEKINEEREKTSKIVKEKVIEAINSPNFKRIENFFPQSDVAYKKALPSND